MLDTPPSSVITAIYFADIWHDMTIEDFWTQAFLAALARVPAEEAKKQADIATKLCIERWQPQVWRWHSEFAMQWRNTSIHHMPPTDFGKDVRKPLKQSQWRLICDIFRKRVASFL